MASIRRKASEQEVKGIGQKIKGVAQEVAGRVTGDKDLRARGEVNQVAGHLRSRAGEAGRKISNAVTREKPRSRRSPPRQHQDGLNHEGNLFFLRG
jgi:uncharacterized protein YjbJ (UPF0337 family)